MHPLRYIVSVVLLVLAHWALLWGGWWTLVIPVVIFGLVPLAELILAGTTKNIFAGRSSALEAVWKYDVLLYVSGFGQLSLVALWIWQVSTGGLIGWSLLGGLVTVGITTGAWGINIAHELGHRRQESHRTMAKALLFSSLYMHFYIEHNRGHHARVATEEDPASAKRGDSVFRFWVRSVVFSWISAWEIENGRLRRTKKLARPMLSLQNQMLRYQLIQLSALLLVLLLAGPTAALAWMATALFGILLLETVNYIEHYGLQRERNEKGRYERVRPIHSWNSNHPLGRVLLFELSRHSDHHAHAARPYPTLRHFDASPQFPTGYPGMILLALVPPLWFNIMHPHIEREMERLAAI